MIPGPPLLNSSRVTLCEGRDGVLWAGTYGKGLWRIEGDSRRIYTTADGLSSDQIRSLYQDSEGTLWIATFGGGLDSLRDGRFVSFTEKDGLLSDNIAKIEDDGESLWLATTRGICRIQKQQLKDFAQGNRKTLEPLNYGVEDGLRSAQCAPAYPAGGGGSRTADGRLWFTTSRGLAVFDPKARKRTRYTPAVHLVEMTADGQPVDLSAAARLQPGSRRIAVPLHGHPFQRARTGALFLPAGGSRPGLGGSRRRRVKNYNSLGHGSYRFHVRADLPGGPGSEASYAFVVLPHFYETAGSAWPVRLMLLASGWAAYQMRLRQIRVALRGGARRARAAGARDSRHAGAGLRGHLFAARCGGHVHAGRTVAGAQIPRHGAAHGAAQPDGSAPLGDGPARFGAGRAGSGGGARIGHAHVDGRFGHRRQSGCQRARSSRCRRKWSSTCCASRRRP